MEKLVSQLCLGCKKNRLITRRASNKGFCAKCSRNKKWEKDL